MTTYNSTHYAIARLLMFRGNDVMCCSFEERWNLGIGDTIRLYAIEREAQFSVMPIMRSIMEDPIGAPLILATWGILSTVKAEKNLGR